MRNLATRAATWLALVLAMSVAVGCAGPQVKPETPAQVTYAAHGAYVAVTETTADLLAQGAIDAETAAAIQAELAEYRAVIDVARAAVREGHGIPDTTVERLQIAQRALQAIQDQLKRRMQQ